MPKNWNGQTKGTLLGYKFFVYSIRIFGVSFAYFFCYFVSGYFLLFSKKPRQGIVQFYHLGFGQSKLKAWFSAGRNFYQFGQILIDRVALKTSRRTEFSHEFENESVLHDLANSNTGGFLFSGHIGNWENAGNLIGERVTTKINILMLDAEVEKIKQFMGTQTEESKFNLIPLKDDLSHIILIHQALKRNELVALHADRVINDDKTVAIDFLGKKANFPIGPFILASKFKVPLTFVFSVKTRKKHFHLSATKPILEFENPEQIAQAYVSRLEELVKQHPEQWFNFYKYYGD